MMLGGGLVKLYVLGDLHGLLDAALVIALAAAPVLVLAACISNVTHCHVPLLTMATAHAQLSCSISCYMHAKPSHALYLQRVMCCRPLMHIPTGVQKLAQHFARASRLRKGN